MAYYCYCYHYYFTVWPKDVFCLFVSINVYKMAPELTPLIWKNSGREKEGQMDAAIAKEAYFM